MADAFRDLGLSDAIVEAARAAGYERPTPLQEAASKVIRRGSNVVLHASSGAGVVAAFGMPVLDRLVEGESEEAGPRALILAPAQQRAESLAEGLSALAGATGIAVRAIAPGWHAAGADVLITTPQRALEAVETSELKLAGVETLVIADAAGVFALNGEIALETLVPLVPRDAQRIVTSAEITTDIERFIESHVRKALTIPARPAAPPRVPEAVDPAGQIGYMIVEDSAKPEVLARLLESVEDDALVFTRTAARAERVLRDLSRRGIADGARDIRVLPFDAAGESASRVISFDVPFSADALRTIHAGGGTVFATAAERAHFRRIAGEVPFTAKLRRARPLDSGALDAFRGVVSAALETEDLDSQLLVLEPLMDEHSPAEVAAALSALLRRRAPAPGAATAAAPAAVSGAPPAEATSGGLTRLFVSVGSRDNIRPGDLVGAITGEANIKGDQVGRVDIRESFSVVEVAAAVAERVIRALNGTTMRGRSLRVDYDRKGAGGSGGGGGRESRGPRAPGGPRGGSDRPRTPRGEGPRPPRTDRPRTPRGR